MKLLLHLGALLAWAACVECVTVCYYGSWATYRPGNGKVDIEDIDPHMCTHLVYAFAGVDPDEGVIKVLDPGYELCPEPNLDGSKCGYRRFNDRKKQNPQLKTLLAVGGWNQGSANFSLIASDSEKRKTFVDSVLVFLKAHDFDGLDMDWEYPGSRGGNSTYDKTNFVILLSELHNALSAENLILTAAVSAGKDTIDVGYDVAGMVPFLDYICLMAYDMYGPWDNFTHHNAPLYAHPSDVGDNLNKNVNFSVQYWLTLGTPAEKLVLGLGTYGRCWSLSKNTTDPDFYSLTEGAAPGGPYTKEMGYLGYNEICENQKNEEWEVVRSPDINEPFAYYDDGEQIVWCGYDDEESIKLKAGYASSLGLGGVMTWSLETDDVHGVCHNSKKFPLIKAADEVFHGKKSSEQESVMSCYYANWAIYRPVGSLGVVEVEDIADLADVCTHLIYAFAGVNEITGDILITDSTADLCPEDEGGAAWWHCGYKDFTNLKNGHFSLKTLIAVGGMGTNTTFSKISADDTLRGNFVNSVVPFLREHNFDGLDMDWEFPAGEADKANFVMLLSELATVLHGEGLLLTAAVPVGISTINSGYDVPAMSEHVDLIHVMAYDFHGTWSPLTHHNAPLYKSDIDLDATLTTDYAIHYWLNEGAPADKLVLGLPMYGRCWRLDDPSKHGVGAPGTVGPNGAYSREPGQLFYSEICKQQKDNKWTIVNDEYMQVPYAYCLTWNNTWCGYDHEESIANKAEYAHNLGLRGVMAWAVDQDDVHKECGTQNFPLTRKAREAFNTPLTTTSTTTPTTTPKPTPEITTPTVTTTTTPTTTPTPTPETSTPSVTTPTTPPTTTFTTTASPTTSESNTGTPTSQETTTILSTTSTKATTSDQPETSTATTTEFSSSTSASSSITTTKTPPSASSTPISSTTTTESGTTTDLSSSTMTTKEWSTSGSTSTATTGRTTSSIPWPTQPPTRGPPSPLPESTIIGIALGTVFGTACIGTGIFWFYINKKLCFAAAAGV